MGYWRFLIIQYFRTILFLKLQEWAFIAFLLSLIDIGLLQVPGLNAHADHFLDYLGHVYFFLVLLLGYEIVVYGF